MLRRVKPKHLKHIFSIRCSNCGEEIWGRTKKEVVDKADYGEWRYSDAGGDFICGKCRNRVKFKEVKK